MRLQSEYAVEEDSPVVIWNDVGFPGRQKLILQVVYYVTVDITLSRIGTCHIRVLSSSRCRPMLRPGSVLLRLTDHSRLPKVGILVPTSAVIVATQIAGTFGIVLTARPESTGLHDSIWIPILVVNSVKLVLLLPQSSQSGLVLGGYVHWRFHYTREAGFDNILNSNIFFYFK